MDIWGTKAARLQRQLDQAQEDLREAQDALMDSHKIIKESYEKFTGVLGAISSSPQAQNSGAAVMFLQNRKRQATEPDEVK